MSVQQVIILVSTSYIQAGYVNKNEISLISVDGNLKIPYKSVSDFERMVESIKDTFNTDVLSKLSLTIVNCDIEKINIDFLFDLLKQAESTYIIKAQTIIPYLCFVNKFFTKQEEQFVSLNGCSYSLKKQNSGRYTCQLMRKDYPDGKTIDIKDFINLIYFDPFCLRVDEALLKNKEQIILEKNNEIKVLEENQEKLKTEISLLKEKQIKLQKELSISKEQQKKNIELNQRLLSSDRTVIYYCIDNLYLEKKSNFGSFTSNPIEATKRKKIKSIDLKNKNGSIVCKNETLIRIEYSDCFLHIKSPCQGKIVYRDNYEDHFKNNEIVGCICDPEDDDSIVKKWILKKEKQSESANQEVNPDSNKLPSSLVKSIVQKIIIH